MFMNTMAVGPLDPTEFCVTGGGATVALPLLQRWVHGDRTVVAGDIHVARFTACDKGVRIAIVKFLGESATSECYGRKFVAKARHAM